MTPEGWTETRFGNAFAKRAERGKAGLPTMSVTINDGLVFRDSIDRKMDTNLLAEEHLLVRKGDIAYNMMRMWQGASGLAEADALVSPAYVVLRPTAAIDPLFAAYLFKHPRTIYLFWAYSHGLTEDRLRLYFDDFSLIPICLPPIPEQQKIADILTAWDCSIEKIHKLIANAQAQKHALMQQLLPQGLHAPRKRLRGFSAPLTATTIAKMGQVSSGGTPDSASPDCWGGTIAWATPTDITKLRSRHIHQTERSLTALGLSSSSAKVVPIGSIIVCTRATIGELAIATALMTTNQGFKNIVPNSKHNSDFIYYLLAHNKKALVRAAGGSTFAEISKADFEKLAFLIPAIDEQKSIATVLINADEAIEKRQSQLAALRAEKHALMQQLLTGKRRVKVEKREIA